MKNLALKLLAFQKEVSAIPKTETNPFFHSKYADINAYLEVVKPLLSKHGLVLLQPLTAYEDSIKGHFLALRTLLIDTDSGESTEDVAILPENPDPQKIGAIITYFRRYAISSLLCLQADDNDGNDTLPTPPVKTPINADKRDIRDSSQPSDAELEAMFGQDAPKTQNDLPFETKPRPAKIVGQLCPDCHQGTIVANRTPGKQAYCNAKCWLNK